MLDRCTVNAPSWFLKDPSIRKIICEGVVVSCERSRSADQGQGDHMEIIRPADSSLPKLLLHLIKLRLRARPQPPRSLQFKKEAFYISNHRELRS